MVSFDHIDCDCGHFDYIFLTIQLHARLVKVQDTYKFVEHPLGCHSRGVSVNHAKCTVTTFAVPRLDVFLSDFQHIVPGNSPNVSY